MPDLFVSFLFFIHGCGWRGWVWVGVGGCGWARVGVGGWVCGCGWAWVVAGGRGEDVGACSVDVGGCGWVWGAWRVAPPHPAQRKARKHPTLMRWGINNNKSKCESGKIEMRFRENLMFL